MPKVRGPLLSRDARGQFARSLIFKRGGIVVNYFRPRNPNSEAQQAQRAFFLEEFVPGLTQEQADLLYAAIAHLHEDVYSPLVHVHDHGDLEGLEDDHHMQYFNQERGDARYLTPWVTTEASSATPTINTDNTHIHLITALAVDISSMTTNLSGTPEEGQKLLICIKDNGTPRVINWGSAFAETTVALPTTTVASTRLRVAFLWNADTSKWDCVGVA